jgi:hypothetical protein
MNKKLFGQGWELSVFQCDTGLTLSIPVDMGHWSRSFHFEIVEADLEALQASGLRHKVLEFVLHERLQRRMAGGDYQNVDEEIRPVIQAILHGSDGDLIHQVSVSPDPGFIRYRLMKAGLEMD